MNMDPRRGLLLGTAACFQLAFTSLLLQWPGLYGSGGMLPSGGPPVPEWLPLGAEAAADLYLWLGVLLSTLLVGSSRARAPGAVSAAAFAAMFLLYRELHAAGPTFLWFQWDSLLLEAGAIAVVVAAPLGGHCGLSAARLLLFKLMFQSGVVKLTSRCPTWWGLTALDYHFESQCIPTPVGWAAHQLPGWALSAGVAICLLAETVVPLLGLVPARGARRLTFLIYAGLMLGIALTGNYTFFNLLTVVIALSLLEPGPATPPLLAKAAGLPASVAAAVTLAIASGMALTFDGSRMQLAVGYDTFESLIAPVCVGGAALALLDFGGAALRTIAVMASRPALGGGCRAARAWHTLWGVAAMAAAAVIVAASLKALPSVDPTGRAASILDARTRVPTWAHSHLAPRSMGGNSYGLFRRMIGLGASP